MRAVMTRSLMLIAAAAALAAPGASRAEDNPRLNANFFRPSVHPGDILAIQTATQPGHLKLGGGAFFTWNHSPLSIVDATTDEKIYGAVTNQFVADLYFSLGLSDYFDIGLDVPIFLYSAGDSPGALSTLKEVSGASLGDIRVAGKVSFFGTKRKGGFGLALAEDLTFPSATPRHFNGDELVTSTTTLILDYAHRGWNVALNLGYRFRPDVRIPDVPGGYDIGDELLIGAGLVIPFLCGRLEGVGTMEYRAGIEENPFDKYSQALDLMGGIRGRIKGLVLMAAAGGGTLKGYGSPAYRVSVNIGYETPAIDRGCVKDRDKDGIPDATDDCPDTPGVIAYQGCADRDNDTVPDPKDRCPDEAGMPSLDGCPDADRDGVADKDDKCPGVPGLKQFQGCPDTDGDGIPDAEDACPKESGPKALKGCPDTDNDGIADKADKCPTVWGKKELDGCPPPEPKRVKVTEEKIEILEIVYFDTGKSTIKAVSFPLLDDVAQVLNDRPNIAKIRVEGHTDNVGKPQKNMVLSQARADAVMKYLVDKGVAAERLTAQGYGDTQPIADNKTKDGRAKNRRVEFMIVK